MALVAVAILAPVIAPHDPYEQFRDARLRPGFWAGNWAFPLGQDTIGRCILSRVLYGGRYSLGIGLVSIGLAGAAGTLVGLLCGYFCGYLDMVGMRVVDVMLNFPTLILALAIAAALGGGIWQVVVSIAIAYTPWIARVVRGSVLAARERAFIEAALAQGAGHARVICRHVLPNVAGPIIVYLSLSLGDAILEVSALGFLGIGVLPPLPEWGTMLGQARDLLLVGGWHLVVFPGLMILLAVLSLNAVGDGLRDALDPTGSARHG